MRDESPPCAAGINKVKFLTLENFEGLEGDDDWRLVFKGRDSFT